LLCVLPAFRLSYWNGSTLLYGPGANGTMLTIDLVAAAAVLIITALLVRCVALELVIFTAVERLDLG
jgi:hypothetical protein